MRVLMAHTQAHTCSGEATTTLVSDSYAHACAMIFVVVPGQKCRRGQKVFVFLRSIPWTPCVPPSCWWSSRFFSDPACSPLCTAHTVV